METVLIDGWLGSEPPLLILDEASVSLAREQARRTASEHGLSSDLGARAALVASELSWNQLRHARDGHVLIRPVQRGDRLGLEVVAADGGPGIADPARVLTRPVPGEHSLRAGLSAVRELAQEVDLDVRLGEGTCVRARIFDDQGQKGREVGIFGRALPGERVSGDHAGFVRRGSTLAFGIADGLGHGEEAHLASTRGLSYALHSNADDPAVALRAAHEGLKGTRGSVMTLTFLDEATGELLVTTAGNTVAQCFGPGRSERFGGRAFVLGGAQPPSLRTETASLHSWDCLILFTDGISGRAKLDDVSDLSVAHPIIIAQRLVERFSSDRDDALVAVAG